MKNIIFLLVVPIFLIGCGGKNPSPTVTYHTITFHSNDGSEVPTLIVEDGKLAVEPKDPSKEAFKFAGWYTEDSFTNYFNFSTKIEKDYDLYARWEGEFEYKVTLEADDKLTLESTGGFFDQSDFTSRILLKNEYFEKYDLPYSKPYYEVLVNGTPIENFEIERVIYATPVEYYVNITIPKEELGGNITIKTKPYCHYLTFTGVGNSATISWDFLEPRPCPYVFYYSTSLDNPIWINWEENASISLNNNKTIYVKKTNNVGSRECLSFVTGSGAESQVACDGNIMSLLNYDETSVEFSFLFRYCSSLISAPVLPSTNLTDESYTQMFQDCVSLKTAPILPATTLGYIAYSSMFQGCTSLEIAPALPATKLELNCYSDMFKGCTSLTVPPKLPATSLVFGCYWEMFNGCTSLKVNNSSGTLIFKCPPTLNLSVVDMFKDTGGDYTADPVEGESYYYTID